MNTKYEIYDIDSKDEPTVGTTRPLEIVAADDSPNTYTGGHTEIVRKPRGFAALSPERRAEISSLGGKRAHEKGTAHKFDSESGREAASRVKNRRLFDAESGRAASRRAREILTEARKDAGVE